MTETALATLPEAQTPAAKLLQTKIASVIATCPDHSDAARQRFAHICMAISNTKEIAACDPVSVVMTMYGCAKLGLVPDKNLGHVYIIPRYENRVQQATLMVGYRGYMELARRSGHVSYIDARVVYKNDLFDPQYGTTPGIIHKPWFALGKEKAGEPWAAYCVAKLSGQDVYQFDILTLSDINAAKKASKNSSKEYSPWIQYPMEMWRKTAVRRASKYWPISTALADAVAWDEQAEMGRRQEIPTPEFEGTPIEAKTDPLMQEIENDE